MKISIIVPCFNEAGVIYETKYILIASIANQIILDIKVNF